MMKIKFRAWDNNNKVMLSWWDIINDCNLLTMLNPKHDNYKRYKMMQYTGLKDCNGLMIWEGDIVQYKAGECHNGQWEFQDTIEIKDIRFDVQQLTHADFIEIIGNVYEDEELRDYIIELSGHIQPY